MVRDAMWLRRVGLGLATAASAFWLFAVIVGLAGPGTPQSIEAVLLAGWVGFSALALIVAWQWQGVGSLPLPVTGEDLSLFGAIVAKRNQALLSALLGAPILLSGAHAPGRHRCLGDHEEQGLAMQPITRSKPWRRQLTSTAAF